MELFVELGLYVNDSICASEEVFVGNENVEDYETLSEELQKKIKSFEEQGYEVMVEDSRIYYEESNLIKYRYVDVYVADGKYYIKECDAMTYEQEQELRELHNQLEQIDRNCCSWNELIEYVESDGFDVVEQDIIDTLEKSRQFAREIENDGVDGE